MRDNRTIYGCDELQEKLEVITGERINGLAEKQSIVINSWRVIPFYVPHTTKDKNTGKITPCPNFGYLIYHKEMGKMLYMTDYEYCKWNFKNIRINHMLIECNYMSEFVNENSENREHVIKGHASLDTCMEFLKNNKTPDLQNIILCHWSSKNSDPEFMRNKIQESIGKWVNVAVAHAGDEYVLNKYPF